MLACGTFGADLNCSESSRGSGLGARWFTNPPQCHLQAARSHPHRPPHAPTALASKGPGAASLLMVDCETPSLRTPPPEPCSMTALPGASTPKVLESMRRQLGVAHRV